MYVQEMERNISKKEEKEHKNAFGDTERSGVIGVARTHFLKLALGIHLEREGTSSR